MAALEDVLGQYNQSNFDIGSTAALIRQLGQQAGLSEAELAAAVPIFGDEHRALLNSGYTEGSNYAAIAQRAVSDALKARGANPASFLQATQGFVDQGSQQANQRWQATQEPDGGLFGDLGPIAQLAALIPGPQQPFLLAANAANSLSQGNLVGAGLNALGAYGGFSGGYNPGAGGEGALSAQEFAANAGVNASGASPYTYTAAGSPFTGGGDGFNVTDVAGDTFGAPQTGMVDVMGGTEAAMARNIAPGITPSIWQQMQTATGMTGKELLGLGSVALSSLGSLYGAGQIGKAATNAANIGAGAADRATQLQQNQYDQSRLDLAPWRTAGTNALAQLTAGTAPGGQFTKQFGMSDFEADPGYGFRMSEGMKALDRSAASRGGLLSGATLKGAQRYGQDMASQEYQNAFNRYQTNRGNALNPLQSLAGVGQTAVNQGITSGQQYATNVGNLGMNTAANQANAGLTAAQANQSAYGSIGNALSNYLTPNPMTAFLQSQINKGGM